MLFSGVGRCLKTPERAATAEKLSGDEVIIFPSLMLQDAAAGQRESLTHNPGCSACSSGSDGYARRHSVPPGPDRGQRRAR